MLHKQLLYCAVYVCNDFKLKPKEVESKNAEDQP